MYRASENSELTVKQLAFLSSTRKGSERDDKENTFRKKSG